jgi:hypothetical protein
MLEDEAPHFNIAFVENCVSIYVVLTNVVGLGIMADVTAGDDYLSLPFPTPSWYTA